MYEQDAVEPSPLRRRANTQGQDAPVVARNDENLQLALPSILNQEPPENEIVMASPNEFVGRDERWNMWINHAHEHVSHYRARFVSMRQHVAQYFEVNVVNLTNRLGEAELEIYFGSSR